MTSWQGTSAETAPDRLLRMELELMRRERDIMQRELQLLQRENELLRSSPGSSRASDRRVGASVKAIGVLLGEFNGAEDSLRNWKKQFQLLVASYELDENLARILIGSKLKGKALSWFQSKTEHLEITTDELLERMETMFGHRESRLEARRKFENRRWVNTENFCEYFHEKLILANRANIADEEIVDSLIDEIPDIGLQNQARMCDFKTAPALLEAFSKIRQLSATKGQATPAAPTIRPRTIGLPVTKRPEQVSSIRCYNCNRMGHLSRDCHQQKREKGSCFGCGETGHLLPTCPKKGRPQITYVQDRPLQEDDFHQDIVYVMDNLEVRLQTLFDTGSPVSFIKQSFVPCVVGKLDDSVRNRFVGINKSPLKLIGNGTGSGRAQ
ncbi:hypothetical protein ANTRET_LOCUS10998 [Anthophora retusa]